MARLYIVLPVHVSCFVRISSGLCGPDGEDDDLLAASARPRNARRRLKGVFAEIRVYTKLTAKIRQNRAVLKGRAKKK